VSRRSPVAVALTVDGDVEALGDQSRTCVYRVVQEGLTNCVRHARASRVDVRITRLPAAIRVEIADDGIGFDATKPRGLGLRGMEERVKELHGTFGIRRRDEGGTLLSFTLPAGAHAVEGIGGTTLARAAG